MSGPLRPTWSGPVGAYVPGRSPMHRLPAGAALVGLLVTGLLTVVLRGPVGALVLLAAAAIAHAVAGLAARRTLHALRPALVVAALAAGWAVLTRGPAHAVEVAADLLALVLAALVVASTTRTDALVDVLVRLARPLRHVGLAPATVALAVALTLRTIPLLVTTTLETRDAARARGLERDPRALVVPAALRAVASARATGEALAARGLGED
ncbi:energy-coupling factor transporter transmembrane component T [Cellulomonas endophytica]|uniref:energy-coupling factor transporter transmembrane component T n=1 Tax=Cellulomonas endophytica TaxID=2494735 RepID=UPI001F0C562E|nr:energy-coupling factor transporter transmembrane component T [Cellulomonas endophytica]